MWKLAGKIATFTASHRLECMKVAKVTLEMRVEMEIEIDRNRLHKADNKKTQRATRR